MFFDGDGIVGASFDAGVVGHYHALHIIDKGDAGDYAATVNLLFFV